MITPKGAKSFAFVYRNRSTRKVEWLTLGRYPDVPLTKAREIANDARKAVASGEVPVAAKVRHVQAERAAITYAKVVELYYDAHLATLRTGHATRTTLRRVGRVYGWNERPIASITDDEAAVVLSDIAERRGKKATANQTKHLLHAMFKWAKQPGRKFVTVNPFSDLPAPGGTIVQRDRFLTADEIRQVWRALDDPERLGIRRDVATVLHLSRGPSCWIQRHSAGRCLCGVQRAVQAGSRGRLDHASGLLGARAAQVLRARRCRLEGAQQEHESALADGHGGGAEDRRDLYGRASDQGAARS